MTGEWPERPRRNIFYSPSLLKALGWPSEKDWRAAAEARFLDLLGSSDQSVVAVDDHTRRRGAGRTVAAARRSASGPGCPRSRATASPGRTDFVDEALSLDPVALDALDSRIRGRGRRCASRDRRPPTPTFHGQAGAVPARAWSVSALETYLECPFKFFAQHVLKLEEEPDDEEVMDPRQQGQFVHEVFETFFSEWQAAGARRSTPDNLDQARAVFERGRRGSLGALSETEAALERTRLLGSSAAAGLGEAVLRMEAERPVGVVGRLLEHRLEGEFTFQTASGPRRCAASGKADRVDLLEDGTFRLIDYKLGWPPQPRARAAAADLRPLRGAAARRTLGRTWTLGEAAYLAFKGPRRVVPLFTAADRDRGARARRRQRLVDTIDAIERGEFPPRPHDVYRCETCTFAAVCRKDYVDDV